MPKRKEPELDPKEQFKRFQEAAKEHGVKQSDAEQAFVKVAHRTKQVDPSAFKKANSVTRKGG